jgi:pimeloyl-ACP methyl ester carboxylesterase
MSANDTSVVLVHGAWADGSSWAKVIGPLAARGTRVIAAPLSLTSFADDVAALDRTLERLQGPIVLAGHAYAGAVIGAVRDERVKALVYVAALAPDEGETVADVFYRAQPHPQAPKLAPDSHGLIYLPDTAFATASPRMHRPSNTPCSPQFSDRSRPPASPSAWSDHSGRIGRVGFSWRSRTA